MSESMKVLDFEIAKKMPRPVRGLPGMSLRSLHMDAALGEASMVVMADAYGQLRSQMAGLPLRHKVSGKTMTIFEGAAAGSCGAQLFAFAKTLPFNTEEALDLCEFLALPEKPFAISSVELAGTSLSIKAQAQLPASEDPEAEKEAAADFYDQLSEILARYNMGVIK